MSWSLIIRIGSTLAGLAFLGMLLWLLPRWSRRRQIKQLEAKLTEHLRGIGVRVEKQKARSTVVHTHEGDSTLVLRHLVTARVWLRRIQSIEIWRISRKDAKESITLDEITFVVIPEQGMSLSRIPILTNLIKSAEIRDDNGMEWRGFEWGRVPLLVDKLKVDMDLNSRLRGYFDASPSGDLRITVLPGDRIGITTRYHPQRLPSPEFLSCLEDIADHIHDYVAERNRTRYLQNSQ